MYFRKNAAFLEQLTLEKIQQYVNQFQINAVIDEYTVSSEGQENITLFLHEKGKARFVFKIYSMHESHFAAPFIEQIMIREFAFSHYLREQGVPAPEIYQTIQGNYYMKETQEEYILFFTLSEFIIGTIQHYSPSQIMEMAKLQARLHQLSKAFPAHQYYREKEEHSMLSYRMKQPLTIEANPFPYQLYRQMKELYNEIQPVLLEFYHANKKIIIHCDIKYDNILMNKSRIAALLDFGDIRYSTIHEDLGASLFYLCEYFSERKREFSMLVPLYLNAYSKASGKELSSHDKQIILTYAIERFLILNLYYLWEEQHDQEELQFQTGIAKRQWNIVKKLMILQKSF